MGLEDFVDVEFNLDMYFFPVKEWFPTFLISRPHSKILSKRSALDITYNSEGVRITTPKIKKQ